MTDAERLATLMSQRSALLTARGSGVLVVQYSDGARVQYRSDAELVAQIGSLDRAIYDLNAGIRARTILFTTSKG